MTPTTDNATLTDDDPFGTTSINRLANELFMESAGSSSIPTPTSHAQPTSPAGLPQGGSGQGITPTSPTNAPRYPGLAGGYPSATPETHPPVHPGLQGALPPATGAGTQSGGHDPSSGQSYPFGEPRCNGTGAQNIDTPSATQPSLGSIQTNPYSPKSSDIRLPFSGFEDLSTPDFYFLRGPDVSTIGCGHPPRL